MPKASSVVASVTRQSSQRGPQSRTEYRKLPKAIRVQMIRWHDELPVAESIDESLCHLGDRNAIGS